MIRSLLHLLGREMVNRAASHGPVKRVFDWRLGARLLRDRRVPLRTKGQSLLLGFLALGALEVLELPLQTALWVLLPLVGFAADLAVDGIELVAVPFFVATIALPFLAPREVVESLRSSSTKAEASIPNAPDNYASGARVYDAPSATIH